MKMKKKQSKPDFFEVFRRLPIGHKATVVVALQMYAQVMKTRFGSVTFSRKDIGLQPIFDDVGEGLDPSKALDFAARLEMEVLG